MLVEPQLFQQRVGVHGLQPHRCHDEVVLLLPAVVLVVPRQTEFLTQGDLLRPIEGGDHDRLEEGRR